MIEGGDLKSTREIYSSLGINIACTSEIDIENNKQQQHMDVVELSGI